MVKCIQFTHGPQLFPKESQLKHLHFIVWAYDRIEPDSGNYINNVILDLIVESHSEAMLRAHILVPDKPGYCIRSVIEHFDGQCSGHH